MILLMINHLICDEFVDDNITLQESDVNKCVCDTLLSYPDNPSNRALHFIISNKFELSGST